MSYKTVQTSAEVVAVIRARHVGNLKLFDTFSDPDGQYSGREIGRMETSYCISNTDFPIFKLCTTWDIDLEKPDVRLREETTYWLCVAVKS